MAQALPTEDRKALVEALARAAVRDLEKGGTWWRTTRELSELSGVPVERARRHLDYLAGLNDAELDDDARIHEWRWPNDRPLLRHLDYDARREPKTDHFCIKCQRDLDRTKPFRTVRMLADGNAWAVHPTGPQPPADQLVTYPIGTDCAYALGIFWTVDPEGSEA